MNGDDKYGYGDAAPDIHTNGGDKNGNGDSTPDSDMDGDDNMLRYGTPYNKAGENDLGMNLDDDKSEVSWNTCILSQLAALSF